MTKLSDTQKHTRTQIVTLLAANTLEHAANILGTKLLEIAGIQRAQPNITLKVLGAPVANFAEGDLVLEMVLTAQDEQKLSAHYRQPQYNGFLKGSARNRPQPGKTIPAEVADVVKLFINPEKLLELLQQLQQRTAMEVEDRTPEIRQKVAEGLRIQVQNPAPTLARLLLTPAGITQLQEQASLQFATKTIPGRNAGVLVKAGDVCLTAMLNKADAQKLVAYYNNPSYLKLIEALETPAGEQPEPIRIALKAQELLKPEVLAKLAPPIGVLCQTMTNALGVAVDGRQPTLGNALLARFGINHPQAEGQSSWGARHDKEIGKNREGTILAYPADTGIWLTLSKKEADDFKAACDKEWRGFTTCMAFVKPEGQDKNIQLMVNTHMLNTTVAKALQKTRLEAQQQPAVAAAPVAKPAIQPQPGSKEALLVAIIPILQQRVSPALRDHLPTALFNALAESTGVGTIISITNHHSVIKWSFLPAGAKDTAGKLISEKNMIMIPYPQGEQLKAVCDGSPILNGLILKIAKGQNGETFIGLDADKLLTPEVLNTVLPIRQVALPQLAATQLTAAPVTAETVRVPSPVRRPIEPRPLSPERLRAGSPERLAQAPNRLP